MNRTRIEWCDFTWNPVVGCTGACLYCYARRMAHRFHLGRSDFLPEWNDRNFDRPFPRKPSRIFVNSMSDVADWDLIWMGRVVHRIAETPQHQFLFLSKRPWECHFDLPENAMLGYTVTRDAELQRLAYLDCRTVSFLSIEPILERINVQRLPVASRSLPIRWIIVGAETGNRKERVIPQQEWLDEIYDYARRNNIPLFFKESLRAVWSWQKPLPQEYPLIDSPVSVGQTG